MAIPAWLRESLHSPVFWARYTFADEGGPGTDRLGDLAGDTEAAATEDEVPFDVGGGYRLLLTADPDIDFYGLEIAAPGSADGAELGWDDLVHWHPFALRWAELDLICRAVAALDPDLPHPGATLALLCRFAAVFEDDDVPGAVGAVDAAYASLRPREWDGYWPSGTDWLGRADFRGQSVVWQRDDDGSLWASQDDDNAAVDFYSTRMGPPASDGFPHAQLKALLGAATATLRTSSA